MRTAAYYDSANYADDELLKGTGVVGLITGDHLHPPMVDDADIWQNSARWREGAAVSVRHLLARARIQPGARILDVGCGVGGTVRMLIDQFGAHAIGLNISGTQLETARKLGAGEYLKGDVAAIPLRSNCLDAVTSINMFYHVADHERALREMFRVLDTHGCLAFDDWVLTSQATEQDRRELNTHWNPEPVRWIVDAELLDIMRAIGFTIEHTEDLTRVGQGVMHTHFSNTFEREVRPMIEQFDHEHGRSVADYFKAAIEHEIRMYREGRMRYLQIVARKP